METLWMWLGWLTHVFQLMNKGWRYIFHFQAHTFCDPRDSTNPAGKRTMQTKLHFVARTCNCGCFNCPWDHDRRFRSLNSLKNNWWICSAAQNHWWPFGGHARSLDFSAIDWTLEYAFFRGNPLNYWYLNRLHEFSWTAKIPNNLWKNN